MCIDPLDKRCSRESACTGNGSDAKQQPGDGSRLRRIGLLQFLPYDLTTVRAFPCRTFIVFTIREFIVCIGIQICIRCDKEPGEPGRILLVLHTAVNLNAFRIHMEKQHVACGDGEAGGNHRVLCGDGKGHSQPQREHNTADDKG